MASPLALLRTVTGLIMCDPFTRVDVNWAVFNVDTQPLYMGGLCDQPPDHPPCHQSTNDKEDVSHLSTWESQTVTLEHYEPVDQHRDEP